MSGRCMQLRRRPFTLPRPHPALSLHPPSHPVPLLHTHPWPPQSPQTKPVFSRPRRSRHRPTCSSCTGCRHRASCPRPVARRAVRSRRHARVAAARWVWRLLGRRRRAAAAAAGATAAMSCGRARWCWAAPPQQEPEPEPHLEAEAEASRCHKHPHHQDQGEALCCRRPWPGLRRLRSVGGKTTATASWTHSTTRCRCVAGVRPGHVQHNDVIIFWCAGMEVASRLGAPPHARPGLRDCRRTHVLSPEGHIALSLPLNQPPNLPSPCCRRSWAAAITRASCSCWLCA